MVWVTLFIQCRTLVQIFSVHLLRALQKKGKTAGFQAVFDG